MPENEEKTMSIARSKKSVISLTDALGPEVLSAFAPGLGLAYKVGKTLVTHARQFYIDRSKERIGEFHRALLDGTDEKDFESFVNTPFSIEDYYTLLDGAIHDQEDIKIRMYSKFFRAIIEKSVPEKYKIHLIKALKELTYADLDLLREIYISSKYDLVNKKGRSDQLKKFVETEDAMKGSSLQALVRLGFVRLTRQGSELLKGAATLTDMLETFVNSAFDQTELAPEAIGEVAWKDIRTIWILSPDTSEHVNLIDLLHKTLTGLGIRCSQMSVTRDEPPIHVNISGGLIVCLDAEAGEKNSPMSVVFINHPEIRHKKTVKILLSASPDGTGFDPLPDVPAVASFDFVSEGRYEIQKFVEFFRTAAEVTFEKLK